MIWDRFRLPYLNILEKIGCAYCGYANGLIHYRTEIVARTEKFWCPIMHAKRAQFLEEEHHKKMHFAEQGDKQGFRDQYMQSPEKPLT